MPYELFNPQNGCNPLLPLNDVSNMVYLHKVNVFEKEFDLLQHKSDGELMLPYLVRNGIIRPKLGLPLNVLFPQLAPVLKSIHLGANNNAIRPTLVGVENIFLTDDKGFTDPVPEIDLVQITDKDLKKGSVLLNGKTVDLKALQQRLQGNEEIIYKVKNKLYRLTAKNARTTTTASKSNVSGGAAFFIVPNFDPKAMPDETYFSVLGELLSDPRSGEIAYGRPMKDMDSTKFDNTVYARLLAAFKADTRYAEYISEFDVVVTGQLPAYEIGLVTTYQQEWKLKGYSRGSLINSITLAPQEELTLEIFTYDKFKIEEEKQFTTEFEKNIESSALSRVSSQIARDLSETTNSNAGGGLGVTLPVQGVPVNIDGNASVNNTVSTGITSTLNNVNDTTQKATERFKSTTQIKISQTHEFGEEKRTIRKIKNHNGSRTLTLNYFEVLETYDVTTSVKSTKNFCLLVENPDLGAIDLDFVLAYEDRLQRSLISSIYKGGFDAARKLAAQRWFEKRSELKTEMDNANKQNGGANTSEPKTPQKPIVRVAVSLRDKLDAFVSVNFKETAEILGKHYDPFEQNKPSRKRVSKAEDSLGLFNYWLKFKLAYPGFESKAHEYLDAISGNNPSEETCTAALEKLLTGMDDEWLTNIKMIAANLIILQLSSLVLIPAPVLIPLLAELALISNDNGLPAMIEKAKKELKNYDVASIVPAPAPAGSTQTPLQPPPPQVFTLEELAQFNAEFEALVLHLEANKAYYINNIWLYEDAASRYERLKAKGVLNYVENRILCFVGNKSAMPLNVTALSTTFRNDLVNNYAGFTLAANDSTVTSTVSLPTSGMYVDSVLGACESLEPYLLERREIEKQMAKAQADLATAKARQQELEAKRQEERIKKGDLDNPFNA